MNKSLILLVSLTFLLNKISMAQTENSYYINFNISNHVVNEINSEFLPIKFKDFSGDGKSLNMSVFNNDGQLIKNYKLSKKFGVNYYTVNVSEFYDNWEFGNTYRFLIENTDGKNNTVLVRKVPISDEDLPVANIVANPINFDCDIPGQNIVDFYADVSKGKTPYRITWVVYDEDRQNLLYSPKASTIESSSESESIRVDLDPSYNVFLYVKDACGNEAQQNLYFDCEESDKKRNTLFFSKIFNGKGEN